MVLWEAFLNLAITSDFLDQRLVSTEHSDPCVRECRAEGRCPCSGEAHPETCSSANIKDWSWVPAATSGVSEEINDHVTKIFDDDHVTPLIEDLPEMVLA